MASTASPFSIYPPNADTWAHSGVTHEDRSGVVLEEHVSTRPTAPSATHNWRDLPGVSQATHWWATMTSLQLRGFIVAMLLLTGVSTATLLANYWMLHASGGSQVGAELHAAGPVTVAPTVGLSLNSASNPSSSLAESPVAQPPATRPTNGLININTASAAELDTLPGVGPATAQSIIAYREANGPFASVDELLAVEGIGEAKLAKIRAHATT